MPSRAGLRCPSISILKSISTLQMPRRFWMLCNFVTRRTLESVITGSKVRLVTKLHNIQNLRGICKAEIEFRIEIEGQRKPALEGIASFLYYFN